MTSKKVVPEEPPLVACEICMKEIPHDVAKTFEGDEYVLHFCGLDCYRQWKQHEPGEGAKP